MKTYTHKLTGRKLTVKKFHGEVAVCFTGQKKKIGLGDHTLYDEVVICKRENLI